MRLAHALRSLAVLVSLAIFAFMPVSAATLDSIQTQDYVHTTPVVADSDLFELDSSGGGDVFNIANTVTCAPLIGGGSSSVLPDYHDDAVGHYENPIGEPAVPIDKKFRL